MCRVTALLGLVAVAACAGGRPADPPAPAPVPAEPPLSSRTVAASAASGIYALRVTIEGRQGAPPGQRGQRRGAVRSEAAQLRLEATPAAAPEPGGPGSQFNAGVQLPGYTRAPRGRSTQAATWWPIPGDSVVVQFTTPRQQVLQLRGALRARELSGDIWFVSLSGSSLQLGTFTAARQGR